MVRKRFGCPLAWLEGLLAGRLSAQEEAELDRHLEGCSACREELESMAAGHSWWSGLRELAHPETNGTVESDGAIATGLLEPAEDAGSLGKLGPYTVLGVLGRGGMGVVLKAYDPTLDRTVAIKVIAPELAASAAARRRFDREARAAAAVSHDHVVAIHAVAESPSGLPYLVMSYIAGKSLQERINARGPIGVEEIIRIGMQTAAGLAAAHAQGLVHRDIKPANILLENGVERVKITDFGLARAADDASLSQSGVVAGTPQYMAPEQARGEQVDCRADLFSLGSLLYAMAAGHPPFRAQTAMGVLRRVSDDQPRAIREINPAVPDWLAAIIDRLLAKNPAQRFQTAAEVADLLARCLSYLQQPGRSAPPYPARANGRRIGRRSRWLAAAAVALLATFSVAEASGISHVVGLIGIILRFKTPEGTLVVEVDDPAVKITLDGKDLVIGGSGPQEVRLRLGEHRLAATKDGKPVRDEIVTITRDNKPTVIVSREPNPPDRPAEAEKGQEKPTAKVATSPPTPPLGFVIVTYNPLEVKKNEPADVKKAQDQPVAKVATSPPTAPGQGLPDLTVTKQETKDETVMTVPRFYRPEPGKQATVTRDTIVTGPRIAGLDQAGALKPVPLDDPSPVPLWPGSSVTFLAYSKDGKRLAVASNFDRQILIFDARTRERTATLTGHSARVWALAFSPDGSQIAAATGHWGYSADSGEVRTWDLTQPMPESAVVATHIPLAFGVAYSPDGKTLAYSGWDDTISLYDLASRSVRATCKGHEDAVKFVAYSPDGKTLASAGWDKTVRLWNPETGQAKGDPLPAFRAGASCLAFSPDGALLAATAQDPKKPDGDQLKVDKIVVWDLATREVKARLGGHRGTSYFVTFSPDGRTMATCGGLKDDFGEVKLWNVDGWKERRTLGGFKSWVGCVIFAPDGRSLIACADHGGQKAEVRAWDLTPTLVPTGEFRPDANPTWSVAYAPDGKTLAVGGGQFTRHGKLWLRDLASGRTESTVRTHLGMRMVVYSNDGSRLISGSFDGTVTVCNAEGQTQLSFRASREAISDLALSPDGAMLATASRRGDSLVTLEGIGQESIKLWNVQTGAFLREFGGGEAWSLAISPDGKTLASGMKDGTIGLWDLSTGANRKTLTGHTLGVSSLAFSPDGKTLASASWDRSIQLWDAATGQPLARLEGHEHEIRSLAFARDGKTLASADGAESDPNLVGQLLIWNVESRHLLAKSHPFPSRIRSVAYSPDGKTLASANEDGVVRFWEAKPRSH